VALLQRAEDARQRPLSALWVNDDGVAIGTIPFKVAVSTDDQMVELRFNAGDDMFDQWLPVELDQPLVDPPHASSFTTGEDHRCNIVRLDAIQSHSNDQFTERDHLDQVTGFDGTVRWDDREAVGPHG